MRIQRPALSYMGPRETSWTEAAVIIQSPGRRTGVVRPPPHGAAPSPVRAVSRTSNGLT